MYLNWKAVAEDYPNVKPEKDNIAEMWWNPQGPKSEAGESAMLKSKPCIRQCNKRDPKALHKAEEEDAEQTSEQQSFKF